MTPADPMPAAPPGEYRLELCPTCLYALEGLPDETRCPECGTPVDRRWQVFGGRLMHARGRKRRRKALIFVAIASVGMLAPLITSLRSMPAIAFLPQLAFLGLITFAIAYPAGAAIAVGPAGVVVLERRGRRVFPWCDIAAAEHTWPQKSITLRLPSGKAESLKTWRFFRNNTVEAAACVRAINALRPSQLAAPNNSAAARVTTA